MDLPHRYLCIQRRSGDTNCVVVFISFADFAFRCGVSTKRKENQKGGGGAHVNRSYTAWMAREDK